MHSSGPFLCLGGGGGGSSEPREPSPPPPPGLINTMCYVSILLCVQKPPSGLPWTISLCLTIPTGADTAGTPFFKGGAAVVYGRGKLLLFVSLLE